MQWTLSWTDRESLANRRVAEFLLPGCAGKKILDVGSGNNYLARFLTGASVHGVTVVPDEVKFAEGLGFCVSLVDKHSVQFRELPGGYDFIVDVNPFGFAPGVEHVTEYVDSCFGLLKPGGKFVSEWDGITWRWTILPNLYPDMGKVLERDWVCDRLRQRFKVTRLGWILLSERRAG